jgi:hypothetical protein
MCGNVLDSVLINKSICKVKLSGLYSSLRCVTGFCKCEKHVETCVISLALSHPYRWTKSLISSSILAENKG